MATTYAALVSLMNLLTRIQHPTCPVYFDQSQIKFFFDKVSSLVDFLEAYSERISKTSLGKMADAAFAAQETIELYYVKQVLERSFESSSKSFGLFYQDLEESILEIGVIIQEVLGFEEQYGEQYQMTDSYTRNGSVVPPSGKAKMVGLDEELLHLMEQLISDKSCRQIIPVVGMGGIGKTTLARNVYENPYVEHHFHIHTWATISQDYTLENVIHSLLSDIHVDESGKSVELLGERLYKSLSGKKYLIILDDMWDNFPFGEIMRFIPDNNNGSRILLTSRISNIAVNVGTCTPHKLEFLDDIKSWDLLCATVFGQEVCPTELIKCGEKIAKSCKGLPLTIVVVGGFLKMSDKTLEYWEGVAENVNSLMNIKDDGHCLEILSLSYRHLPVYLKPCFLYMATLGEDEKVDVSDLTKLWVAEGFLKPHKDRFMEDVAVEHLNHLINRNLIMVGDLQPTGQIRNCSLHDLLREFCLKEARNEHFLYHVKNNTLDVAAALESERRLVFHVEFDTFVYQPLARSLTCNSNFKAEFPLDLLGLCDFLLVMNTRRSRVYDVNVMRNVNLRYLACKIHNGFDVTRLFSSPSLFWNLETLDIDGECREYSNSFRGFRYFDIILPSEFWELPNLRHVSISMGSILLPYPTKAQNDCILHNLQTLFGIANFNATNEVIQKIPELKTLVIRYGLEFCSENSEKIPCYLNNLATLRNLEKLSCDLGRYWENRRFVFNEPNSLTFSTNLKELYLYGSYIPWENMNIIGSLPKLEVLGVNDNAFCGDEWNTTEGEFQCLKYLSIMSCDLPLWMAESSHFPRLEHLELWELGLEEIPLGIGEAPSLQLITLYRMKMSVIISAKEILDERQNQQNLGDHFFVKVSHEGNREERMELDNLASATFQVTFPYRYDSEEETDFAKDPECDDEGPTQEWEFEEDSGDKEVTIEEQAGVVNLI